MIGADSFIMASCGYEDAMFVPWDRSEEPGGVAYVCKANGCPAISLMPLDVQWGSLDDQVRWCVKGRQRVRTWIDATR